MIYNTLLLITGTFCNKFTKNNSMVFPFLEGKMHFLYNSLCFSLLFTFTIKISILVNCTYPTEETDLSFSIDAQEH